MLALDKETGHTKWRTVRPDAPPSYSTPILWRDRGQIQIITAGSGRVAAYGFEKGDEVWSVLLPDGFVAATPVVGQGLLFVAAVDHSAIPADFTRSVTKKRPPNFDAMFANHDGNRDGKLSPEEVPRFNKETFDRIDSNGDGFLTRQELGAEFRRQQGSGPPPAAPRAGAGNVLLAVRPGGRGDVTDSHVVWRAPRAAPYVASPLLYGDHLYVIKGGGIVSCLHAATGELVWQERLGAAGAYYASPVAGAGKVYLVSEDGHATVIAAGPRPQVLSRNLLSERCLATPALVGGRLYFRTQSTLYCVGRK